MAKLTKSILTRGQKLSIHDWNTPIAAMKDVINGTVDPQNLQQSIAPFSMTLNFPRLPAYAFGPTTATDPDPMVVMVPFILPPLQDNWTDTITDETPLPILRSMSVSLDTGMGNNIVTDAFDSDDAATHPQGSEFISEKSYVYNLEISIKEKDQSIIYGHTADVSANVPRKVVYETSIDGLTLFNDNVTRFNPLFIDIGNVVINPKKTYVIYINAPDIWDGYTDNIGHIIRGMLSNLTIKLNFEGPLLERDTDEFGQNFPTNWTGVQTPPAITVDTAVTNSLITARGGNAATGRIQRNIETLDAEMLKGLASGRDMNGVQPTYESISQPAAYSVIAVPLFGGWNDIRSQDVNTVGLPYFVQQAPSETRTPWPGYLLDKRVITIGQPFTIHNVIFIHNYYGHSFREATSRYPWYQGIARTEYPASVPPVPAGQWNSAIVPTSATFNTAVGVGILNGLRTDLKHYEQVAYATWTPSTKTNYLIDRVKAGSSAPLFGQGTRLAASPLGAYDQEIFQIPLVPNIAGGADTRSYYDQGGPYYIGRGNLSTYQRDNVGIVGGGTRTPRTVGGETQIEVRCLMYDENGLQAGAQVVDPPSDNPNPTDTCYVGMGGCFLYIIGKAENATSYK